MPVKVACRKCRAEIVDPPDFKDVLCPACGHRFNSEAASPIAWTLAAILVLCTLIAMWVTAARVKAQKLAARAGERIEAPVRSFEAPRLRLSDPALDALLSKTPQGETVDLEVDPAATLERQRQILDSAAKRGFRIRLVAGDSRQLKVEVSEGRSLWVEHFELRYRADHARLSLLDARGRPLVDYPWLGKGRQCGWQELRMSFLEIDPAKLTILIELHPGFPSFGSGYYAWIRPGLRVDFDPGLSATVMVWDESKPELKLKLEAPGSTQERTVILDTPGSALGIEYLLGRDEGHWFLMLNRDK